ncbi:MAG TPA: LuxR C-terminal-related transcriptional regulator [Microlunatus sp.]|nr:LuxR C-terminal-related transcriptional regulator [Microlunatus sp.]
MARGQTADAPRAGALDELVALVREAAPAYSVVVTAGGRGSGRTTLLRAASDRLGLSPVWIDCTVFAQRSPLQSLRDALSSSSLELFPGPMAARLDRELARPDLDPAEVSGLVWSVIRPGVDQLAGMQVVADDFDLLDPQSQQVAAYVLRRIAQLGTPVLLSVEEAGALLERFPTVELPPLDVGDARVLIEDAVGVPVPYRVAERITGRCGGNVLALTAVVRELGNDELGGRALLPHPLPLARSVANRLCSTTTAGLTLLAALALEETVDIRDAVRMTGSADALQAAVSAGEVEYHGPRIRAAAPARALAAWWLASTGERDRVHRILGESRDHCAAIHRASVGDDVSAADLVRSAEVLYRHSRQGHAAIALDLLDWVLPASGFPLAEQLMADGYVNAVRAIIEASEASADGLKQAQLHALHSQVAVLTGYVREPLPLADLERRPAAVTPGWAQTVLGVVRSLLHREDLDAADRLLTAILPAMTEAPADCRALDRFVRAELAFHRHEDRAAAEFARAAEEWLAAYDGHDAIGTSVMVFYLLAVGNPQLAGAVLNRTRPADSAGSLNRAAHVVSRLQTEVALGHYVAADGLIGEMDRTLPFSGGGTHTLAPVIATGAARGPARWRDRIEWRLDHPDVVSQPPQARSEIAATSGTRCLVEGEYERAVVLLEQALESRSGLISGATAVLASLLEARLAAGSTAAENRAVWSELGNWWPDRHGPRYPGLEARCRALCAEAGQLDAAFETAVASCAEGDPFDLARTSLAYGRRLLLQGRDAESTVQLDRAVAIFTHERLTGWVEHVQRLPSARHSGLNGHRLGRTEREVVALVLQRRTNAEIARTLFMSKRTVELHLTRIFRKLGVGRKSELIELDSVRSLIVQPSTPSSDAGTDQR